MKTPNFTNYKDILKRIESDNYSTIESFVNDAKRYVKAIKEERVICSIGSVSSSGMSRTIKFLAPEKNTARKCFQYYNFYAFFRLLGLEQVKNSDYFRIHGCGMDMIFESNYRIIHKLCNMGLITKKQCSILEQKTPSVI